MEGDLQEGDLLDKEHYTQKLNSNQEEYNKIYDSIQDRRQYVEGDSKLYLVQRIDSGSSILQRLINSRRKTGVYKICEHLNNLNPFADLVGKQNALDKLNELFERKKRASFQDIRSAPYIFKVTNEKIVRIKTINKTLKIREGEHMKFLKKIDALVTRKNHILKNGLLN